MIEIKKCKTNGLISRLLDRCSSTVLTFTVESLDMICDRRTTKPEVIKASLFILGSFGS